MQHEFYNPHTVWEFFFKFHNEKIFRRLFPMVIAMLVYAAFISLAQYLLSIYASISIDFTSLGQFHLLFNFILSILIAFRLNTACARWWEGRGLWGQVTNHSRSLALRFDSFLALAQHPQFTSYLSAFPAILKFHLRGNQNAGVELIGQLGLAATVDEHLPNLLLQTMHKYLNTLRHKEQLSFEQFLLLSENLAGLIDALGGCEKILNTRVPSPINTLIKQALIFYMLIFPFGWSGSFGFFVIPMIIIMIYVLWGLEAIADELENPFGSGPIDLPLPKFCDTIAANIKELAARS